MTCSNLNFSTKRKNFFLLPFRGLIGPNQDKSRVTYYLLFRITVLALPNYNLLTLSIVLVPSNSFSPPHGDACKTSKRAAKMTQLSRPQTSGGARL
uniref:Uncharacterized protein n=1 Tax=Ditylenchus dipsaci TaxID=166011 RepID=A0A915E688_9BILA